MNPEPLDSLLHRFRRQIILIGALRVLGVLLFAFLIAWSAWQPTFMDKRTPALLVGGILLLWLILAVASINQSRTLQMARVLLGTGQTDNARVWLSRVMTGMSLSPRNQFIACHHLASLFAYKHSHHEVIAVCTELLRHRLVRLRHIVVNTRLMLAESLLSLDRVGEAYEAMRPVYDLPLTLADRMKLLPVQLWYELQAGQAISSVQSLPEKVRIAELLDSQQAALVHAMLAEACRQRAMPAESEFLLRRARLYADLEAIIQRYPVLAPIGSGP